MGPRPTQAPSTTAPACLVLYDGVCGLCNGIVQFILRHDRRGLFKFAAIQGRTGRAVVTGLGGDADFPSTFYVVSDYETDRSQVFTKGDGVLFVASRLGWPWRMAASLRLIPKRWRDRAYDAMARSRYGWFGRYDECLVPQPEYQDRFIN